MIYKTKELFDLDHTIARSLLEGCEYPHMALTEIDEFIKEYSSSLDKSYSEIYDGVYIADDAIIWNGATIIGPAIIGHKTEIRPGAFIRGCVVIGDGCVIGNSTEVKNSIIFDRAQLPHYNYVGDSILGYRAHLGAGVIISNLRLDKKTVRITKNGEKFDTGLRKMGALVGDFVEIGCNSVLCPGTVIGKNVRIFPLSAVRGTVEKDAVIGGKNPDAHKTIKGE